MKVKLDEHLPRRTRVILAAAGIDVDTVEDEALAGADDVSVGRAATEAGRLVITLDRGFGDVMRYPPGSHAGILVLRVDDQSAATVCDAVRAVIQLYELDSLSVPTSCDVHGQQTVPHRPQYCLRRGNAVRNLNPSRARRAIRDRTPAKTPTRPTRGWSIVYG